MSNVYITCSPLGFITGGTLVRKVLDEVSGIVNVLAKVSS